MRLVIDMQGAQTDSRFRGIGRYAISLVQAMIRGAAPHHEVFLVVNAQMPEGLLSVQKAFEGLLPINQIRVFDVPINSTRGSWCNQASESVREAFLTSLNPDVVLITSFIEADWQNAVTSIGQFRHKIKTAVILYDLIPLIYPDTYLLSETDRKFYFNKLDGLKKADLLLAISKSSYQEAIELLQITEDKLVNVSAAIGDVFRPTIIDPQSKTELLQRFGIAEKFILYTPGGFDSRKNFEKLMEAFSLLPEHIRENHQLVIVSKLGTDSRDKLNEWRNQFGLSDHELILPGYVEDSDLIALYSFATLFVFPSLHEGFGLPVLEALACGAPVIGSNCTSIPEVIGCEEALFDPKSASSIRDKIVTALTDQKFLNRLKERSAVQAGKFSWDNCAKLSWQSIESLNKKVPNEAISVDQQEFLNLSIQSLINTSDTIKANDTDLRRVAQCLAFNLGHSKRQLLLDVSELARGDARSGIQRVVRSLLRECLQFPPPGTEVRPIRFDGTRYWYANELASKIGHIDFGTKDEVADFFQGDIYVCLDLLMHLGKSLHDSHRDLSVRGISLNYVIYDLLPLQHPEWWPPEIGPFFYGWLTELSKNADRLVCISKAVANELSAWLKNAPPQQSGRKPHVESFHLGADLNNSVPSLGLPENAASVLQAISSRTSFLMVGTVEPRKGHSQTLDAFELLWSLGHDALLVIVGKRGWSVDELVQRIMHHPENGQRLQWIENASDEFLEKIYAMSDCLIMASLGEGFGLPLIEAAQHKLPIITRDLPVLREIGGAHAHYFSGVKADDLSQSILDWLRLKATDNHPKSEELPWLTWKSSTRQLLDALKIASC